VRFASLGSGSKGNASLIEVGDTLILLDSGFSVTQLQKRLAKFGKSAEDISAVVVTHEHADHLGGVPVLARRFKMPVYMTPGTAKCDKIAGLPGVCLFNSHDAFEIGDVHVQPFPVPHDAREPCQFVFGDGKRRLGILSDVGCWTPHIESQLSACDALMLEANHDVTMLAQGPYPPSLKRRVRGDQGHLSNEQSAELLGRLDTSRLQHLVVTHLSEQNNTPELARRALSRQIDCDESWIAVACQNDGLDWREIS